MTDNGQLADIHAEIFKTQLANGRFPQEQTVAKNRATTEMRTMQPVRNAPDKIR